MLAFAFFCLPAFASAAARSVALGAPDSWKYVTFDPATRKVFVAHGNEITVVDAATMQITGHVPGLSGAHGVAIVPGGSGYAASSKSATVTVFDPRTLRVVATLKAGKDANSVTYDPVSRHVFVANDDTGTITIIDAASSAPVATLALPGGEGLESAAADGTGHLFVNHSAQNNVVRIDTRTSLVDGAWKLPGCTKPRGLAVDATLQRLFVSCDNSRLLVLDQHNGRPVAMVPIGPASDTVLSDTLRHLIYTPNRDGTLSVINVASPDRYVPEAAIPIAKGAHTATLDLRTGIVYLVAGDLVSPAGRREPGLVKLFAVDPAKP